MISLALVTESFECLVASVGALQEECDNILRVSQNTHHHTPWKKYVYNHKGTVDIIKQRARERESLCEREGDQHILDLGSLVKMCCTDMKKTRKSVIL